MAQFFTRAENKPIYYRKWIENGIFRVEDLQNQQGKLLNFNTFTEIYEETNIHFLDFFRIHSLVKTFLNSCSHQPRDPMERQTITLKEATARTKMNRRVYSLLLSKVASVPKKVNKSGLET